MFGTKPDSAFLDGLRVGAPFVLVVGPFALLFGVVGSEAGLNLAEVMGFSFIVLAGAGQLTAVQLMVDEAPTLIVLAAALAVNLRMAMYSAALTPHLGAAPLWKRALMAYTLVDQNYAPAALRFEAEPDMPLDARIAYFAGLTVAVVPLFYAMTLTGALAGSAIPPAFALDFALPITFLAIIAPALRTVAHVAAALVSVAGALVFAWMPYNSGLLIAALAAMAAGAQVEVLAARRHA